jgi:hypothetical protein
MKKTLNRTLAKYLDDPFSGYNFSSKAPPPGHVVENPTLQELGMDWLSTLDPENVRAHLEKLEHTFDYVVIAERMQESLILLRHKLGWDLKDVLALTKNRRSSRSRDPQFRTLSDNQMSNLEKLSAGHHWLKIQSSIFLCCIMFVNTINFQKKGKRKDEAGPKL